MTNYLKSFIVLLPLIIGLIRFKKIDRDYQPFVYLLILYFVNENINFMAIKVFHTNAIPYNIFSLFECLFILYQFYRWGFLKKRSRLFFSFMAFMAILWTIENIGFWTIIDFSPYFRVFYAFIIVLISVNQINYLIIHDSKSLFRNAKFLISIGFIIFFMYQILYEGSLFVNHGAGNHYVAVRIISLFADMNIFINLLFAVAVYFIPVKDKRPFTLDKID